MIAIRQDEKSIYGPNAAFREFFSSELTKKRAAGIAVSKLDTIR